MIETMSAFSPGTLHKMTPYTLPSVWATLHNVISYFMWFSAFKSGDAYTLLPFLLIQQVNTNTWLCLTVPYGLYMVETDSEAMHVPTADFLIHFFCSPLGFISLHCFHSTCVFHRKVK